MSGPHSILYAHSSDELYGSDIVLFELASRLSPAQFRPLIVTPQDIPYAGQLSQRLQDAGIWHQTADIPVLRRRYLSPRHLSPFLMRLWQGPRQLAAMARHQGVAIIHSNTSAVWGGALTARRLGIPHLWHVHEIVTRPLVVRKLIALMVQRYSDHVVAISQAVADHLLSDQPRLASRMHIIHNAVDTEVFQPQIEGASLRSEWGIAEDKVLVGMVGRISTWKGQEIFLQALAEALPVVPNLRAVIVGEPVPGQETLRTALQQQAHQLGIADKIIWAGYRSDTPQVMAALDVLVLPSLLPEPFGMVILEAMATGKPVIASAHGGPLESVDHERTGLLVKPQDPRALAQAMILLAEDHGLCHNLGNSARQHVLDHFTFQRHVSAFQDLYQYMLEPS